MLWAARNDYATAFSRVFFCKTQPDICSATEIPVYDARGEFARLGDEDAAVSCAAQHGHHNVLSVLLPRSPNLKLCRNDMTPLMWASRYGHVQAATLLLKQDPSTAVLQIEPGYRFVQNHPLKSAVHLGHEALVSLFLNAGVFVNDTTWVMAVRGGILSIITMLLDHTLPEIRPIRASIGLSLSAERGGMGVLRKLLDAGADPQYLQNDPLRTAVSWGRADVVSMLIEAGANATAHNVIGMAAYEGHTEVVRLLLADAGTSNATKALAYAVTTQGTTWKRRPWTDGHHQSISLLLNAGADVHANHNYALDKAVRSGVRELVLQLLEAGWGVEARQAEHNAWKDENRHEHSQLVMRVLKEYREAK